MKTVSLTSPRDSSQPRIAPKSGLSSDGMRREVLDGPFRVRFTARRLPYSLALAADQVIVRLRQRKKLGEDLKRGDSIEAAKAITSGDIVYFEGVVESRVLVRILTEKMLSTSTGRIFVVAPGNRWGALRFVEVSRDDLE